LQYRTNYPRIITACIDRTLPPVAREKYYFISYLELVAAAIFKGFTMHTQKENRILLGRRKFILATFSLPFLIGNLRAVNKIGEIDSLLPNKEDGFIVLGGWVLLKDDLIKDID
jgi:hypothetical protein